MSQSPPDWLPSWPPKSPEIRQSVQECLESGDWGRYPGPSSGGKYCQAFQTNLCQMSERQHCQLVSSGSIAVEYALRAAAVGPGDAVAVCGYDYPGNMRAIELVGATPVLIDAAPDNYSICPDGLSELSATDVKVVIASHLYGIPASIARIRERCDQRQWILLEDACQVPGMDIEGRPAGNWGDLGVYSFGGSKPLTAGTGGAIAFDNSVFQARLRSLIDRPSSAIPLSELHAAALLPQLASLSALNHRRCQTAAFLVEKVLPELQKQREGRLSAIRHPTGSCLYKLAFNATNPDLWANRWAKEGLPVGRGYRSMHRSSNRRCRKASDLTRCQALEQGLVLLDQAALLTQESDLGSLTLALGGG